ncbi:MAG: hypothetical protein IJB97_10235 [Clostridia bacterium]|nr:hypothetical protein [Clostridia bacterium]
MTVKEKIIDLRAKVKALETDETLKTQNKLPSNCYFLNDDEVVCYKREFGDARYPYSRDGLTLWAYSSGNIKCEEGTFNVFLDFCEGKEPNVCFFAGEKRGDRYFPVSLTGLAKQPIEDGIERYTVYTPTAAYYFTETAAFTACVRMFVDDKKNLRFTVTVLNETDAPLDTYVSAYFNCMLSHMNYEYIETKWYRRAKATADGFAVGVTECINRLTCLLHYAYIARDKTEKAISTTTSRADFNGGMHNQLYASTALQNGKFGKETAYTEFIDTAIAGDIIPLTLKAGEWYSVSYTIAVSDDEAQAERLAKEACKTEEIDALLYGNGNGEIGADIPKMRFDGFEMENLQDAAFNSFLKNVFRQAEFCARAKNYAGPYIGIRDIFQQLEAALIWIPDYCRKKIVEALNYIGENGRPPRQYSYSAAKNSLPAMDMRPYVDQGVWIISTVYTYLCYTNDFSILDEECGYYKFPFHAIGPIDFSAERDSVLCHLLRICEFLIANLDEETGCLRALYGDWNDSLDGLGKTEDTDKEYGSGVSVMATLQLYKNLGEICEILKRVGKTDGIEKYQAIRERIRKGLQKHAIVENGKGDRKIVHGWGDKLEHKVAGFCDIDGYNRDSLTSNTFWVLCGALAWDESWKKDILSVFDRLDSKYGLKTFEPYFGMENKKVGRLVRLPKGTAENGATYIHATLFAIWSLFEMNEPERAWTQLLKILPPTHTHISTTPFVMPNSYVHNEERGFDGESMSDWFTGSGCVLLKVLIWYVFGARGDLDGLTVAPASYIPFSSASAKLKMKGAEIAIEYVKTGEGRTYSVNGVRVESVRFDNAELKGKKFIVRVTD